MVFGCISHFTMPCHNVTDLLWRRFQEVAFLIGFLFGPHQHHLFTFFLCYWVLRSVAARRHCMVESRAVLLDGLTSGGHGSRIVNPQRAQAASEKGAAYERLGFPANQKRVRHRILSFFSRRLLLKQKKCRRYAAESRFPGCQARITRPNQNVNLVCWFCIWQNGFQWRICRLQLESIWHPAGYVKICVSEFFLFILCSLALFLIKCGFLWMKSSVLFLHVANPCSWMWSTKLWPKTAVCFSYRVRSSVGSMCWDVLVCHSLLFMHVAQLCCWRSSLHIALFEMKFFVHRFLSCISFIFYWNIPRFTHFDLC